MAKKPRNAIVCYRLLKLRSDQISNLSSWGKWLERQGSLPLAIAGRPSEIIPSMTFNELSEFEQARLLWRYKKLSDKDTALRGELDRALEASEKAGIVAIKLGIRR